MTITEFLAARLKEQEDRADDLHERFRCDLADGGFECTCGYPARVLREIEVKRYLLAVYEDANGGWSPDHFDGYWDAVWRFAAVYSDHPDYDADWAYGAS